MSLVYNINEVVGDILFEVVGDTVALKLKAVITEKIEANESAIDLLAQRFNNNISRIDNDLNIINSKIQIFRVEIDDLKSLPKHSAPMTEEAYNAIPVKDPNTFYYIIEE